MTPLGIGSDVGMIIVIVESCYPWFRVKVLYDIVDSKNNQRDMDTYFS